MNQPFTILREITPGQWFSALDGWNTANKSEDEEITPPSAEWWQEQQDRIRHNPHLTMSE